MSQWLLGRYKVDTGADGYSSWTSGEGESAANSVGCTASCEEELADRRAGFLTSWDVGILQGRVYVRRSPSWTETRLMFLLK